MLLYIFCDAITGEMQQPILAHNDEEAMRIARMAFANVPHEILRDLYLARMTCYDYETDPMYDFIPLYRGLDFISEAENYND